MFGNHKPSKKQENDNDQRSDGICSISGRNRSANEQTQASGYIRNDDNCKHKDDELGDVALIPDHPIGDDREDDGEDQAVGNLYETLGDEVG